MSVVTGAYKRRDRSSGEVQLEGNEVHGKQADMQNTRAKKTNRGLHKVGFQRPYESSDIASGSTIKSASRSVRTFFDGGLHFIEILRLRSTEKVSCVQVPRGWMYCEKFIRVVSCTAVSRGAERDERDASHDEKPPDFVVPLRQWQ